MSTKIFNGYRLPASTNPLLLVAPLSEAISRRAEERAGEVVAYLAALAWAKGKDEGYAAARSALEVFALDTETGRERYRRLTGLSGSYLALAKTAMFEANRELQQPMATRNPVVDITFSCVFLADPSEGDWMYALKYEEGEGYEETWESLSGMEPYPYWNNTDAPDGVSEKEWDERREVWDRVLGHDAPARRGLCWELSMTDLEVSTYRNDASLMAGPAIAKRLFEVTAPDSPHATTVEGWTERLTERHKSEAK